MGADFMQELVTAYLEDTPAQLELLAKALSGGDTEGFRRAAHTIKSTSLNFGAQGFAAQAKALEERGRLGELEGTQPQIDELNASFNRVRLALKGMGYE